MPAKACSDENIIINSAQQGRLTISYYVLITDFIDETDERW
jgi:hypothetical protein